jgi:hypothetical protein
MPRSEHSSTCLSGRNRNAANQRMAQSLASSQSSALQEMSQSSEQSFVNRIQSQRSTGKEQPTRNKSGRWCGGTQLSKREECPASGHECGRMGHFSPACLQRKTTAPTNERKLHNVDLAETVKSNEINLCMFQTALWHLTSPRSGPHQTIVAQDSS